MIQRITIIVIISCTLISCGHRSGVSDETENAACGVEEAIEKNVVSKSESEINGQKLFNSLCSECHSVNKNEKCGDLMKDVCDRIPHGNWFRNFVQNSDGLKQSGDPYANKINKEWKSDYEHNFKSLTEKEIQDIYNYLKLW